MPPQSPYLLPSASPSPQTLCARFVSEFPFPVAQVSPLFHLLPPPRLWTISPHGTLYFMQNYTGLSGWATSAGPGPLSWENLYLVAFSSDYSQDPVSVRSFSLPPPGIKPTAFDMPGKCCIMNCFPSPQFPDSHTA